MEQIYKYRSFSASIASGYKLFRSNIRTILTKSWIEAIGVGVVVGLALMFIALRLNVAFYCALAALVIALILWNARLFQLIDGGKWAEKFRRSIGAMVATLLFTALPLVGIPLMNTAMETMLEEKPSLKGSLATGFRHWGYLLLTLLISGLIMFLLSLVICVPLYICLYALFANQIGIESGDPDGLPSSFPMILFFVGMLTSVIWIFVQLWQTYALAYAHGAILDRDRRKKEMKEKK